MIASASTILNWLDFLIIFLLVILALLIVGHFRRS